VPLSQHDERLLKLHATQYKKKRQHPEEHCR